MWGEDIRSPRATESGTRHRYTRWTASNPTEYEAKASASKAPHHALATWPGEFKVRHSSARSTAEAVDWLRHLPPRAQRHEVDLEPPIERRADPLEHLERVPRVVGILESRDHRVSGAD